ncbi:MAG: hypothetical protein M3033_18700 [Acidobacteriota bacterium]|nr:hypothetical protein [Acidobacteriota bacterium]
MPDKNFGRKNSLRIFYFLVVLLFVPKVAVFAQSVVELDYNFRFGSQGWTADFADYSPASNANGFYELYAGVRFMPRKLTRLPQRGFYIQGNNHSDDLFMFLKRRLTSADGILAGRAYRLEYAITLASDAPSNCFGIGGSVAEGVTLKVGASPIEPLPVSQSNGYLIMNVDKGNQAQGGAAASAAGNIANGIPCSKAAPYYPFALLERSGTHTANVSVGANGELWLLVGTDSGFEGLTRLYYQSIRVLLVPV